MAASQVLNERVPLDHDARGPVGSQPTHRPQPGFEPAVITLVPVVLTLPSVMERRRDQLIDHAGQRRRTVGDRPQDGDLHVRLTGKPLVPHAMPARAGRLSQLGGEALNPPVQRDVIHLDSALNEQFLQVPVGQPVAQGTDTRITSEGNRNPANTENLDLVNAAYLLRLIETPSPNRCDPSMQQCPFGHPHTSPW